MCNRGEAVLRLSAAALPLPDLVALLHLQQLSHRSHGQDKPGTWQLILDNALYRLIDSFVLIKAPFTTEPPWVLIV